jgi:hypothetical protein
MGEATIPEPVKLFCAALAGREEWLVRAFDALVGEFGRIDIVSDTWPFDCTDYYEAEMGPGLLRRIASFQELIDPARLVEVKLATNALEKRLARQCAGGPPRPVNLDPGFVSLSKVVLATTKDYSHRIYMRDGIYAEVTLRWRKGRFEPWEWTYPDYRKAEYIEFFSRVRAAYAEQRRVRALRVLEERDGNGTDAGVSKT